MTVPTLNNSNTSTGDGTTKIFPFDFALLQKSDLQVYIAGVLQSSGYSISINQNGVGGTVTFTLAPGAGLSVARIRIVDYLQGTELPTEGNMPEKVIENMVDKVTMEIQQIVNRGIGDVSGPIAAVDGAVALFDGTDGNLLKSGPSLPASGAIGDVVGPASSVDGNLVLFNGSTGKLLKTGVAASGVGDVIGPGGATDSTLALFNGSTGKLLKQGIAASGLVVGPAAVSDGNLAVFDGATGKLIKDGGPVPGGGGGSLLFVKKKVNDTTRQLSEFGIDTELQVPSALALGQYFIELWLYCKANVSGNNFRFQLTQLSADSTHWQSYQTNIAATGDLTLPTGPGTTVSITGMATNVTIVYVVAQFKITIAGSQKTGLNWSADVANASGSTLYAGSLMKLIGPIT